PTSGHGAKAGVLLLGRTVACLRAEKPRAGTNGGDGKGSPPPPQARLTFHELSYRCRHVAQALLAELGIDRQRQRLAGRGLGVRQILGPVAQGREALL